MKRIFPILAALLFATAAPAHDVFVGSLHIIHPSILEPIKGAQSGAAYMVIANEGTVADRLLGVETGIAAMAMMHKTEFGTDGVARMVAVPLVDLLPGDIVSFEPGGMHVMLMGLNAGLKAGDEVPFTLIFETAGRVEVEFVVDPSDPNAAPSEHNH